MATRLNQLTWIQRWPLCSACGRVGANVGPNGRPDSAVRLPRLPILALCGGADGGGDRWASNDSKPTNTAVVPNSATLEVVKCLRYGSIANRVSSTPCAIYTTEKIRHCQIFKKKIMLMMIKFDLKME